MADTAADVFVETIMAWGLDTIFGIPGGGVNGVIESLRKRNDKIKFIQTRHEESAAFMACAYAKYTGKLGCCLATSGPGAIHLLSGLYDAKFAEACGGVGITVHDPNELKPALEKALTCGKAAVVEVYVDPNEPPLPGCIQPNQAIKFAEALAKGQPEGGRIALTAFRDKISDLLHTT